MTDSKLKIKGKIIATPTSDYELEVIDKQFEGKQQNVFGLNNLTQKEQLDKMNRSAITELVPYENKAHHTKNAGSQAMTL